MPICDWPLSERPREKLLSEGPGSLSDAELLAIFLGSGYKGQSAVDMARTLVSQFGGLRGLLNAEFNQLNQIKGIGQAKFVQIRAILEISQRCMQEQLARSNPLTQPQMVKQYLKAKMRDYTKETFSCLFLDSKNQIICFKELFHGTIDAASIYPREIIKTVLSQNAAAVMFAHNHPSGNPEPSAADRSITQKLKTVLNSIDVRLLDHFVVGDNQIFSFAEEGLL